MLVFLTVLVSIPLTGFQVLKTGQLMSSPTMGKDAGESGISGALYQDFEQKKLLSEITERKMEGSL